MMKRNDLQSFRDRVRVYSDSTVDLLYELGREKNIENQYEILVGILRDADAIKNIAAQYVEKSRAENRFAGFKTGND